LVASTPFSPYPSQKSHHTTLFNTRSWKSVIIQNNRSISVQQNLIVTFLLWKWQAEMDSMSKRQD
jgi:hypothetical protein